MHFCLYFVLPLAIAADDADALKAAKKELAGGWTVISAERDGEALPEDDVKKLRLSFAEEKLTLKQGEKVSHLPYFLHLGGDAHQIDVIPNDGPQKGNPVPGIYELKGDTLKICMSLKSEAGVPDGFSAAAGSGRILLILKREK